MSTVSNRASAVGLDTQLNLHTLILTPFYPTDRDEAGCLSERLLALAAFIRYASLPGGWGLSSAGGFLFARILARVRELHHRQKIDLIHAHPPLPCGHAAMLLSRELNVPFMVSVHGLDVCSTNQVRGLPGEWCRRLTREVFRSASRILCISDRVREQVVAGANGVRTSVVYNGADPELFSPGNISRPPERGSAGCGNATYPAYFCSRANSKGIPRCWVGPQRAGFRAWPGVPTIPIVLSMGHQLLVFSDDQMSAALNRLIREPDLTAQMSSAAIKHAEKFDWDRITEQQQEIMERAIVNRKDRAKNRVS